MIDMFCNWIELQDQRKCSLSNNKPAVLLLDGVLDFSATWLLGDPGKGLLILLITGTYEITNYNY